ncbi:LA domain protein (macronuclear) [Tetrahymena thermophila SB210]|uniref:LA domain protein n=1 Tax=Tetrahymena thermophila (strain SB210) TaxID=312017 RepID=Q23FX4_TETTS|nr:LA domain protein [Tetrahymena thermophila SB210]EAR95486.2 LA domain protein [Tetrahymena thermophila SB210]|eukprot:XP_001015731.2 LA domain protein [Tetrahymena thermophila SB210]
MRIKLILINHQVENQSNFLISIPFNVQTFGDFNEYLKEYFELPESTHLQFQLDGFCILHKESIHQMLKELDTLKVTLASQETLLQKRKGSTLSSTSVKKLKKEEFTENKLAEFINDMLQIQRNIELEQNKNNENDSSFSSEDNEEQEKKIKDIKKSNLQKQQNQKSQRVVNNIKNDKSTNSKDLYQKINSFKQNLSKAKALKSSSESSSDSSEESESEIENVPKFGNKMQGSISAKYQKVLEKEASSTKQQQIDKNSQGKQKNPIQATFQKGETFMQPIETLNAQAKVIQSKNQQQQLVTQAIKQAVDSKGIQNLQAKGQQLQQVQINQAQARQLNSIQTEKKQDNQTKNVQKLVDLQKQNTNVNQKDNNANNKVVAEKPTLQGVLNKKIVRKASSSDSSSSSSDDDSEPEIIQKQSKIQLSFEKQKEQLIKTSNSTVKQQVQEQHKSSEKVNTPLSKQNQQHEEKPQSSQTTPSSKPTLQPLLKGPKQEHVLNLNLKSPLEIYEEKKILWKQISPFITKMDKKLKKLQEQQAQKSQKIANEININSQTDQHNQQKENQTLQKSEAAHQNQQIQIKQNKKDQSQIKQNDQDQDLPPFDLKGFDKINLKDIVDYEKCLQKNFFNENDQIYFKEVELDEEAQCPKLSEWKRGTVTQIINVKKVKVSVSVDGKMESSTFDTSVFKALYLKTSIEQAQEKKEQVQQIQEETKKEDDSKQQQQNEQNTYRAINDKNILVGRTVNYYYSDKNYYQDKYILEHSNRNQDHYMPLSLLLNFPKIKKEVNSIEDLVQKLQTFIKITNQVIQFELNADKTMIRKKQLKKDQSNEKNFQKQNNQNHNKNQKQNNHDSNKNNQNNNANKNGGNVPKLSQTLINQIHNSHKDQSSSQINNNNNLKKEFCESQQFDEIQQKKEKFVDNQKESEEGEFDEKMQIESQEQNKDNEINKNTQMEEEKEQKTITQQIVQNVEQQIIKQINELSQQNH